jgi:hypothetical protein
MKTKSTKPTRAVRSMEEFLQKYLPRHYTKMTEKSLSENFGKKLAEESLVTMDKMLARNGLVKQRH